MKFLIDANLPAVLVRLFTERGHEALHTSNLPEGNATDDEVIINFVEEHTVVTKDTDFYQSFLLKRRPPKLIFVRVGNMRGTDLVMLFHEEIDRLIDLLGQHDCLELHRNKIVAID